MNKKILIIATVVGALLVAGIVYVFVNKAGKNNESVQTQKDDTTSEQTMQPQDAVVAHAEAQAQPGAYKTYSEPEVAATKGTKILFFHAQWCPQCRQLDSEITAGPLPENVTIFKVNYDTAQALRQKYGVTLQTTFVKIDDAGNLVQKYVAYDEPTLAALIRNIL